MTQGEIMRQMATIRRIEEIRPIPDADKICSYRVGGWWVVDSIGKYSVDDLVVYCEIDSFIPHEIAPFLSKGKEPREYEGVKGERLRTVKLKGQISQGLLLPLEPTCSMIESELLESLDVSNHLNIQKYEPPIPAQLAGLIKGNFPSRIPKTDQERIQNLSKEFIQWKEQGLTFEITEKCDGSSMTCYVIDNEFGVCSRNLDLKFDENNTFWKVAIANNFEEKLKSFGKNIAIQGELIGMGVNGNIYKMNNHKFVLFDIYDIDEGRYFNSEERNEFAADFGIEHVPVIQFNSLVEFDDIQCVLTFAEGKSIINPVVEREGLVFKCQEKPDISFKSISNRFLIKNGD
jgi:RNA ligase (TIGR02306 family)